jgi:hypothetical protein
MGREAHEDPRKRYTAADVLRRDLCGDRPVRRHLIAGLLTAFPKELVAVIAGLALLGTIGNALAVALQDESHREAAADHLPGHAQRRGDRRGRLGLLGRGGRRLTIACATIPHAD